MVNLSVCLNASFPFSHLNLGNLCWISRYWCTCKSGFTLKLSNRSKQYKIPRYTSQTLVRKFSIALCFIFLNDHGRHLNYIKMWQIILFLKENVAKILYHSVNLEKLNLAKPGLNQHRTHQTQTQGYICGITTNRKRRTSA